MALAPEEGKGLLRVLKARFEKNMHRHAGLEWDKVEARIVACTEKQRALHEMERTGGEPDVVGLDQGAGAYIFFDCSLESPINRRSLCYDEEALNARKNNKPEGSAVGMATSMGIRLLTEVEYRELQSLGRFDQKTSSWIVTPVDIRTLGGAIFADFRYGQVFVGHNGAESYFGSRGFRGSLRV